MSEMRLVIHNRETNRYYWPAVEDGVSWELNRKGAPGKLTFKVLKDEILDFSEGNTVQMDYNDKPVFFGYVFSKKRNRDRSIEVTAYDQMRYLKNKDIYLPFVGKTASEIIRRIAADYELEIGEIADTVYAIPRYLSSNECLIDTMQNLLDRTMENTNKIYVLYDDCGKLTLKEMSKMIVNILIDADTAEDFSYESSIDKDTYTRVKLYHDDKNQEERKEVTKPDDSAIKKWGILQLTESVNAKSPVSLEELAASKLKQHSRAKRSLSIKNAFGDTRVRAGSMLYVQLNLGDVKLGNEANADGKIMAALMLVESVKHKFSNCQHTMDLTLKGAEMIG